jgi:hypothetical protein
MIELEVYKKSDFYEDYISSQKEYYERENADAYFAEKLAEKDKVIAELEADYTEACGHLQTANLIKDEQLAAARHQKYKRCLAMARWCRSRACFYDTMREDGPYWSVKSDRAYRWYKWWFKTAIQFKDAK